MPEISVIIPFYNEPDKHIRECLDSMHAQRYRDFEVLAVDDGSTNKGAALIGREYPWVKLHRLAANGGSTAAINYGLAQAKGNFLSIFSMDDFVNYAWLDVLRAAFDRDLALAVCGGHVRRIDERGHYIGDVRKPKTHADCVEACQHGMCPFSAPIFKREIYERLGGQKQEYFPAEDFAYWVEALRYFKGGNIAHVLATFRKHPGRRSAKFEAEQGAMAKRIRSMAHELRAA